MIKLIGYRRLRKDLRKLGNFQRRVHRAMIKKETSYRKQARDIVMRVVYSHKANPAYPRSGNLAASTNVINSKGNGGDGATTIVFLDPTMATRKFAYTYHGGVSPQGLASYWGLTGQGGPQLYPSYVRVGNFFGRKLGARDFRAGWFTHFVPIYRRDAGIAIRRFKR